jgi:hypothetical protein
MNGARLLQQADLSGARGDRNTASASWRTANFVVGLNDTARHFIGLSERSWLNWTEQIRQRCGEELLRRGMFPPRKYFSGGD